MKGGVELLDLRPEQLSSSDLGGEQVYLCVNSMAFELHQLFQLHSLRQLSHEQYESWLYCPRVARVRSCCLRPLADTVCVTGRSRS